MSKKFTAGFAGLSSLLISIGLIALAWFGGRPLLRGAEQGFWSLNALAVQPVYALFREGLRHLVGRLIRAPGHDGGRTFTPRPPSVAASW